MLDYATIYDALYGMSLLFSMPALLIYAIIGIVIAFHGYSLYTKLLRICYAFVFGIASYAIFTFAYPIDSMLPQLFELSYCGLISIAFAVIGALLAPVIHKFIYGFIVGASIGFCGAYFGGVPNWVVIGIIAGVAGLLVGLLFIKIFKPLFIVCSSLEGMSTVASSLSIMLFPYAFFYELQTVLPEVYVAMGAAEADVIQAMNDVGLSAFTQPATFVPDIATALLSIAGLVVGIIAIVYQFKKNSEK